ncbi:MAG: hypothetical protein AAF799_09505 [Myxococcota bacterium]
MRLSVVDHGHSRVQRAMLWVMRRIIDPIPGPVLALSYRPALFGRSMAKVLQRSMRKAQRWEDAECELFSAFVSKANRCEY